MQFLRTPKEREPPSPGTGLGGGSYYELSMYKESPAGEVALEEFEKIALDRLRSENQWRSGGAVVDLQDEAKHAGQFRAHETDSCAAPGR
jgi:hypothetical protein